MLLFPEELVLLTVGEAVDVNFNSTGLVVFPTVTKGGDALLNAGKAVVVVATTVLFPNATAVVFGSVGFIPIGT